ncbi:MAG: ferredoxin reductase [Gaiellaceae bacterium]
MARAAVPGRLTWQLAEIAETIEETPSVHTLLLDAPAWAGHRAGQHVDVRLTAADGYQAQRSYSIASAPEDERLALTVERLDDGEVSPYLVDELRPGDQLELRGPIGGYFAWDAPAGGPLLLIGGGSGIVPLRAILRHRVASGSDAEVRLLASWRTAADIIYTAELAELGELDGVEVDHTLTRKASDDWAGRRGRIDAAMLAERAWPPEAAPICFVCGPTGLVVAVASGLVELGHGAERLRTERFGPTGG